MFRIPRCPSRPLNHKDQECQTKSRAKKGEWQDQILKTENLQPAVPGLVIFQTGEKGQFRFQIQTKLQGFMYILTRKLKVLKPGHKEGCVCQFHLSKWTPSSRPIHGSKLGFVLC